MNVRPEAGPEGPGAAKGGRIQTSRSGRPRNASPLTEFVRYAQIRVIDESSAQPNGWTGCGKRWYVSVVSSSPGTGADLDFLRTIYGESAAFWAVDRLSVGGGRWIAMSGSDDIDYNQALWYQRTPDEGIEGYIDALATSGAHGVCMLAGEALEKGAILGHRGWACIGASPLMVAEIAADAPGAHVREISGEELVTARSVVSAAFHLEPRSALVALPDDLTTYPGTSLWGLYENGAMAACVITVVIQGVAVIWSMATAPQYRTRGLGGRLLASCLSSCAERGAGVSILMSTPMGVAFYLSHGFRPAEYWQLWSRPRWALAPC